MANFLKSLFVKGVEIDTASATTGKVLTYDGTKFAPATPGAGSLALDDLSDVIITTPLEFQTLEYNGTEWVNTNSPSSVYVRNAEATTLTTGTCVYLFGATGDHATVKRADNNSDATSAKTVGVVSASILASENGVVVTQGYVDGIDLSTGYTAGDVLWLGESGAFTTTKPTAPDHLVFIGVVVRATINGIIYVATQNGYELDELHNVSLPSPQSGEFLKYNGSLWVADAIDLGTDTTGNYMSGVTAGTGISVTHTPAEGSSATIAVDESYNRLVPSGSIITWGGSSASPPSGYLTCDGTTVSRTTYAALYAVIGDRYGAGNGSTTFTLPNFANGLLPFSTTTLNASPGTGTRQTQTVNVGNTASSGHTHTLNNTQSSGHSHTMNSTSITANTGGSNADHSHGVSFNSGGESADHSHSGNTGNISADHSHTYFKPNSGGNANTAGVNSNHTHAFTSGGRNVGHTHLVSGNTGGRSVDHSHAMTHTHTAANIATTNSDTGHLHTFATTNSDTAHLHAMTGTYVVYLIKT